MVWLTLNYKKSHYYSLACLAFDQFRIFVFLFSDLVEVCKRAQKTEKFWVKNYFLEIYPLSFLRYQKSLAEDRLWIDNSENGFLGSTDLGTAQQKSKFVQMWDRLVIIFSFLKCLELFVFVNKSSMRERHVWLITFGIIRSQWRAGPKLTWLLVI